VSNRKEGKVMPCDEWQKLANKAKEAKLQRDYLASTEVTGVGANQLKKKLRIQSRTYIEASRRADEHRHQCSICKIEPPSHFRDLELGNEKLKKRASLD
jgi:hypothetical protein